MDVDASNPVFTAAERNQPLFKKFMRLFEARIALHRERNDQQSLDPIKTAHVRGQIEEAKFFVGLALPTQQQVTDDAP